MIDNLDLLSMSFMSLWILFIVTIWSWKYFKHQLDRIEDFLRVMHEERRRELKEKNHLRVKDVTGPSDPWGNQVELRRERLSEKDLKLRHAMLSRLDYTGGPIDGPTLPRLDLALLLQLEDEGLVDSRELWASRMGTPGVLSYAVNAFSQPIGNAPKGFIMRWDLTNEGRAALEAMEQSAGFQTNVKHRQTEG